MKLVLAEKPSVAQSIAKVLGANERCDGYLEGNGYGVSWCVGHLVELFEPEGYDERYSKWKYDDLPIVPDEWKYQVSAGTRKQFWILRQLMNRDDVKSLVCATDAGREGELIFRLVYNVTPIKNKYGFRVKLIYADGTSTVQQKSGYTSKKAAEQARTEIIGQLYANAYVVYENILLEEFLEFWLEDVMRPKMKNSSYVSYRNSIHRHINPHLGKVKLTKLNRGHIQQLYNKEMKVSESAVKLVKTVMNTAMGYALEKKMISVNPAEDVDLPKQKPKTEFRVRHIDEQKTLNQEQVDKLIEAAKDTPIYLQVMFAVLMGLRRSEIIAVKYSDIDYINRTLHVERQLGIVPMSDKKDFQPKTYTKQEIELKTESSDRIIPIPDILFEAIIEERQKYEKNRRRRINDKHNPFFDGNYICCSTYGKPRSKDFHWVHFKKLLKENDLPDIRWHDLRATYCTILLKNDFNPKAVSKLMGHAKEIITIDVYGDNREIIEDCLENLEPFIDEVIPEEEPIDLCDVDCMDFVASELIE